MKHWVFDLDGTLVDSFEPYFIILSDIFKEHGEHFNDSLRMSALTQPLPEFFEHHLGKPFVAGAMETLQRRSNEDAKLIRPFDGVLETIKSLRERGERIAIWTNRDLVSAKLIIKHSGLEPLIEICVSGTCTVQRKPFSDGLVKIMHHFGCQASSVTMVGDHEYDVTAAKNVGARAVRASWHRYWIENTCPIADFQFHRFEDFSQWAKRANLLQPSG